MALIATILGLLVVSVVMVTVVQYQIQGFQTSTLNYISRQVADEQVTFAHSVAEYLQMSSLTEGDTITVANLEAADLLPSGFPAENPLGQTPMAYIGTNSTALVTYTAQPAASVLAGLGIDSTSVLSMSSLSAKFILQASAFEQPYASSLVAVEISGSAASSPFAGQSLNLGSFFSVYPTEAVPMFSELVNLDTAFSGQEAQ